MLAAGQLYTIAWPAGTYSRANAHQAAYPREDILRSRKPEHRHLRPAADGGYYLSAHAHSGATVTESFVRESTMVTVVSLPNDPCGAGGGSCLLSPSSDFTE